MAGLLAACVIPLVAAGFLFRNELTQLLGRNPEIEKDLAESQKVSAEKKQEAEQVEREEERVAHVASDEPKAQVPERPRPPVVATNAAQPKLPVAVTPGPPVVAANTPKAAAPRVAYLKIPEPGEGVLLGHSDVCTLKLNHKSASFVKIIQCYNQPKFSDDYIINFTNDKISVIGKNSISNSANLLTFSINNDILIFAWGIYSSQQIKLIEPLRDSVLVIEYPDTGRHYVMLRDPGAKDGSGPLPLTRQGPNGRGSQSGKGKLREAPFQWASRGEALKSSRWPLFIRRWRITSWLNPNGEPILISSGEGKGPGTSISETIIKGEVELSLKLDETQDERENGKVVLEFLQPDPNPKRRSRDKALSEFLKGYNKDDRGGGAVGGGGSPWATVADRSEKIDERLKEIEKSLLAELTMLLPSNEGGHSGKSARSNIDSAIKSLKEDRSGESKEETIKKKIGELEDLRGKFGSLNDARENWETNLKEDCLHLASRSELCLVISLKADENTVIDIAKIGNW